MVMNRKEDVETLLKAVEEQHFLIKLKYNEALTNKKIEIRVYVKNLMENLRSALDYMAHDIYESICKPPRASSGQPDPRNIYFPYAKNEADFKSRLNKNLPDLESISKPIHDIIFSIQPFKCGDNWLYNFCEILNHKKHERLVPQERHETETYSVQGSFGSVTIPRGSGCSVTSIPGAVEIFGVPAQFMGDSIATHPAGNLNHIITRWVAFQFEGTSINVLELLDKSVAGIRDFSNKLYSKL
jgi:hypothetical protein